MKVVFTPLHFTSGEIAPDTYWIKECLSIGGTRTLIGMQENSVGGGTLTQVKCLKFCFCNHKYHGKFTVYRQFLPNTNYNYIF